MNAALSLLCIALAVCSVVIGDWMGVAILYAAWIVAGFDSSN